MKRLFFLLALTSGIVLADYKAKETLTFKPLHFKVPPYLQFVSPESAVVFWETHQPGTAVLEYGKTNKLEKNIPDTAARAKHQVTITGLEPDTVYSYRIKTFSGGVAAGGETKSMSGIYEFDTAFNYTVSPVRQAISPYPEDVMAKLYARAAETIISETGKTKGYCLVYGCGKGQLAFELAKRSELMIVCVGENPDRVAETRKLLRQAGVYGKRITARYVESLAKLPITSNFANLIVSDHIIACGTCPGNAKELFRMLRPDGGVAYLGQPPGASNRMKKSTLEAWLEVASIEYVVRMDSQGETDTSAGVWAKITRPAPAGAGSWTHQYGNPGNSANSGDTLQGVTGTGDLEIQWIGRPGADFGIDRNPRMPAPLSVNGRLFHQGLNRLIALDAYNGAILWSVEIPDLRRVNMPRDASNWCADKNFLYVAIKERCWVFNANGGQRVATYALPDRQQHKTHDWGYIAQAGNLLYGSSVKKGSVYTDFWGKQSWYDRKEGYGTEKVCSDDFFACAKDTGRMIWKYANGVIINTTIAIGDGKVFFVESRNPEFKNSKTSRIGSGKLWSNQHLVALNARTGKMLWEKNIDTADGIVVFFLVYADESVIISSSASGEYHLYCYDGSNGRLNWQAGHKWPGDNHSGHMQHPVVAGKCVYLEPCGYDLKTGKRVTDKMGRHEGCATYAAVAGALIYRGQSRRIAMWDLKTGKVSSWFNLRPSCWLSVIPAGGMVLAPEGGGGCSCGNWLETSLGFAPKQNRTLRKK